MIIKLCNDGGSVRHIECVDVTHFTVQHENRIHLRITTPKGEEVEALLGPNAVSAVGKEVEYQSAYVMENGRTVDSIKAPCEDPVKMTPGVEADEAARITEEVRLRTHSGAQRRGR